MQDRSAYDLTAHTAMSKVDLKAYDKFPEPRMMEVVKVRTARRGLQRAAFFLLIFG